jgi:hypothetical protein
MQIEKPVQLAWYRVSKPIFQVVAAFEEVAPAEQKLFLQCCLKLQLSAIK